MKPHHHNSKDRKGNHNAKKATKKRTPSKQGPSNSNPSKNETKPVEIKPEQAQLGNFSGSKANNPLEEVVADVIASAVHLHTLLPTGSMMEAGLTEDHQNHKKIETISIISTSTINDSELTILEDQNSLDQSFHLQQQIHFEDKMMRVVDDGNMILQLSEKNKLIIAANVRHYSVLFWMLFYANSMMIISFLMIFYKFFNANEQTYSISLTMYILPLSVIEVLFLVWFNITAFYRIRDFKSKRKEIIYTSTSLGHFMHYLVVLIVLAVRLYQNLGELREIMEIDLNKHQVSKTFVQTQTKRQCCGIDSPKDWHKDPYVQWKAYPSSCCPTKPNPSLQKDFCFHEYNWTDGCFQVEYSWIVYHVGTFFGLVGLSFLISIAMAFQLRRFHRYLQKHLPQTTC